MIVNKTKNKYKIQTTMELILILSLVAIVAIVSDSLYLSSIHNAKVGTLNDIISAQASSSNTLVLKLSSTLPTGVQIKNINLTGVPPGTTISVSLENQTPIYSNGYPEYSFSVDGLPGPLPYYNVTSLTYEANGRTIVVPTITGEPIAIEETSWYSNSNTNSFPKPTSIPSGILYYVPITITNTQDISTSKPFQQMIQVQETQFSNYIAYNGNMANFEFFTQSGQVLPAWIESNTSGDLIIWVKIPGIPAKHSETIYLGFASKTANLLSSSGTSGIGEAPQLSSTYGQYDDGASVFNFYDNFAGTTLSSKWATDIWKGSYTVSNGITIDDTDGGAYLWSSSGFNPNHTIADTYVNSLSGTFGGVFMFYGSETGYYYFATNPQGFSYAYGWAWGGPQLIGSGTPFPVPIIVSQSWQSSNEEIYGLNYSYITKNFNEYALPSSVYYGFGLIYMSNGDIHIQWRSEE
ncbi:MAG: DUF2341 domain-containing protein, partial [Thermoproteota archaeon]